MKFKKWAGVALMSFFIVACAAGTILFAVAQKDFERWAKETSSSGPALWASLARDQGLGNVCAAAATSEALSHERAMAWVACLESGDESALIKGSKAAATAAKKERLAAKRSFEEGAEAAESLYGEAKRALGRRAREAFDEEGRRPGGVSSQAGRSLMSEALAFAGASAIREGRYKEAEETRARAEKLGREAEAWAKMVGGSFARSDKLIEREWGWAEWALRGKGDEAWAAGPLSLALESQLRLAFEMEWKGSRPAAFSALLRQEEASALSASSAQEARPWEEYAKWRAARAMGAAAAGFEPEPPETPVDWRREAEAASERQREPRASVGRSI